MATLSRCLRPCHRIVAAGVAALLAPAVAHGQQQPTPSSLAFSGVTVVDVRTGKLLPEQTVVITGTRVRAMGQAGNVQVARDAEVIDARGKYLIPGLWDMHVHVTDYPQVAYPLFIANGVTGVRDMHHWSMDSLLAWRADIVAGRRVGPRMIGTGGYLGISSGMVVSQAQHSSELEATTVGDARYLVDSIKASRADFIKVRGGLSREVYFATAAEARRLGIPLVGHLSDDVTPTEASDSGQRSIEHVIGQRRSQDICPYPDSLHSAADSIRLARECAALAARLRRNQTWVTTTLSFFRYHSWDVAADRMRFWPETLERSLLAGVDIGLPSRWQARLAWLKQADMPILAATDVTPDHPTNTAGFALHDELALFVEGGGMTPLEALQTATLNPAEYLHATDSLGTVAAGKLADLVLLDANPLADIHNTAKISAVVANGRYFDRAHLDALIAEVERAGRGRTPAPTRTP